MIKENVKSRCFEELFREFIDNKTVIVCIGDPRSNPDCFAPILGTILQKSNLFEYVYGSEDSPISSLNVKEICYRIVKKHPDSMILAIGSDITKNIGKVGDIHFYSSPFCVEDGEGKEFVFIGDYNITAVTLCNQRKLFFNFGRKNFKTNQEIHEMANGLYNRISKIINK